MFFYFVTFSLISPFLFSFYCKSVCVLFNKCSPTFFSFFFFIFMFTILELEERIREEKLNFLNWFVSRNVTNDERNVRIYTWISIRILLLSSVTFKYMKWQFFDLLLGIYFFTLSCFFCFFTFHIFIIIIIIIVRAYPNHKSVWVA